MRSFLSEHADDQVDAVNIVVVHPSYLLCQGRVTSQFLETAGRREVQQFAELVIARHAQLPRAHNVRCRQVHEVSIGSLEVLQEAREVIQDDGSGIGGAERVKGVSHRDLLQDLLGMRSGNVVKGAI